MTEFKPTDEQVSAKDLALKEDHLKIEAIAGGGKTRTLGYIADNLVKPSLYIAFNKSMALEASEKFPAHVECKTMHSLAYKHVGHAYQHKLSRPVGKYVNVAGTGKEIATYFRIPDFEVENEISGAEPLVITKSFIGLIIKDTVGKFESSADEELGKQHTPTHHIRDLQARFKNLKIKQFNNMIKRYAGKLWEERTDKFSEVLATHDTYLKLFQLKHPQLDGYEVLYLDEMQDSTDCFLDIVQNQEGKKCILVGDSRQSIYMWRGAVNAMEKVAYPSATLSQSFRYGQEVADVAMAVLEGKITIKGCPTLDTVAGVDVVDFTQPHTYIFRTNTNLIFHAIDLIAKGESVNLNIDVRDFVDMVRSAEALYNEDVRKVKHESIIPYATWVDFCEEANYTREFKRIQSIVEDGDADRVISTLHAHKNSKGAKVSLTTAHKAKGLEYQQVVLADDFPSIYNHKGEYVGLRLEEQNLLYVACTRALGKLQYNSTVQEILSYQKTRKESMQAGNHNIQCGVFTPYDSVRDKIIKDLTEDVPDDFHNLQSEINFYSSMLK